MSTSNKMNVSSLSTALNYILKQQDNVLGGIRLCVYPSVVCLPDLTTYDKGCPTINY